MYKPKFKYKVEFIIFSSLLAAIIIILLAFFRLPEQDIKTQKDNLTKIANGKTIYCKRYNFSDEESKDYIEVDKSLKTKLLFGFIYNSKIGMYDSMQCVDNVSDRSLINHIPTLPNNVIKVTSLSTKTAPIFNVIGVDFNGTLSNNCLVNGRARGNLNTSKIEYRVVEINCLNNSIKSDSLATLGSAENLFSYNNKEGKINVSSVNGRLIYLEEEESIGNAYLQVDNNEELYILCHTQECTNFFNTKRYNEETNLKKWGR